MTAQQLRNMPYVGQAWSKGVIRDPAMFHLVANDLKRDAEEANVTGNVELWENEVSSLLGLFVGDTSGLAVYRWRKVMTL
jgi:hypothetical protein